MALDNKYFSFCKTLGLMKENRTRQQALDAIVNAVKGSKAADPAFVAEVSKLTLNSKEVSIRVCVLYHYDMNVNYVLGGHFKNTRISDYGHSGVPDSLKLTQFGEGTYTTLKSASEVPFPVYNNANLFTLESMKTALAKVIDSKLPSSSTDFKTDGWDVSAYFVPTLVVNMSWKGKDYPMYYNLQNGCYHWDYPDNPALLKKGTNAKSYALLAKVACFAISIIAFVANVSKGFGGIVFPLIALVADFFIAKKTKHSKSYYQKLFLQKPERSILSTIKFVIPMLVLNLLALIVSFAA